MKTVSSESCKWTDITSGLWLCPQLPAWSSWTCECTLLCLNANGTGIFMLWNSWSHVKGGAAPLTTPRQGGFTSLGSHQHGGAAPLHPPPGRFHLPWIPPQSCCWLFHTNPSVVVPCRTNHTSNMRHAMPLPPPPLPYPAWHQRPRQPQQHRPHSSHNGTQHLNHNLHHQQRPAWG